MFVGIADLIPMVGATIGGVVAGVAGFVHSIPAGIAVVVFIIIYQQFEDHLLQPMIFSTPVQLNPLTVLIGILIAVQLAGLLGALLAIPIVGMIQVIFKDIWSHRRRRAGEETPTGVRRPPPGRRNLP